VAEGTGVVVALLLVDVEASVGEAVAASTVWLITSGWWVGSELQAVNIKRKITQKTGMTYCKM
jgi:hypothetical protein